MYPKLAFTILSVLSLFSPQALANPDELLKQAEHLFKAQLSVNANKQMLTANTNRYQIADFNSDGQLDIAIIETIEDGAFDTYYGDIGYERLVVFTGNSTKTLNQYPVTLDLPPSYVGTGQFTNDLVAINPNSDKSNAIAVERLGNVRFGGESLIVAFQFINNKIFLVNYQSTTGHINEHLTEEESGEIVHSSLEMNFLTGVESKIITKNNKVIKRDEVKFNHAKPVALEDFHFDNYESYQAILNAQKLRTHKNELR